MRAVNQATLSALILISLCSTTARAGKTVILAGGGCEGQGPNQFREKFQNSVKAYEALGWKVITLYNQGEPIQGKATLPFHAATFESAVRQSLRSADGSDELLIQVMTHGSSGNHGYCMTRGDGTEENFEASRLASIVKEETHSKKKSQRPRLALYDQSCFGGGSLPALDESDICVVSSANATTTNNDANPFDARFLNSLKRGRSLEEVFLRSLHFDRNADAPNPQISSNLSETIRDLDTYLSAVREHIKLAGPVPYTDFGAFASNFRGDCATQNKLYSGLKNQVDAFLDVLEQLPDTPRLDKHIAKRGFEESLRLYHRLIFEQNELLRQSKESPESCPKDKNPEACARLAALGWDPIHPQGFYAMNSTASESTREIRALWDQVLQTPGNGDLRSRLETYQAKAEEIERLGMDLEIRFEWIRPMLQSLYDLYYMKEAKAADSKEEKEKVHACRKFRF